VYCRRRDWPRAWPVDVLRVEPDVHARLMVGVGNQVSENIQNLGFQLAGEVV
jgi:hypothetical protein